MELCFGFLLNRGIEKIIVFCVRSKNITFVEKCLVGNGIVFWVSIRAWHRKDNLFLRS